MRTRAMAAPMASIAATESNESQTPRSSMARDRPEKRAPSEVPTIT